MTKALGKARYPLIIVLVVACVTLFIWSATIQKNQARAFAAQFGPTTSELEVALLRSGLGPEMLAAAGLSSTNASTVVSNLLAHMNNNPGVLDSADASYASSKLSTDQLKRTIQSGLATTQDLTAYTAANANLVSATTTRDGVIDAFFTAATDNLNQGQINKLNTIVANAHWDKPTEFLAANRNESQWVELRDALAHERIAAANAEAVNPNVQTILDGYRNHASVTAARANIDSNLATITAAWNQAIAQ